MGLFIKLIIFYQEETMLASIGFTSEIKRVANVHYCKVNGIMCIRAFFVKKIYKDEKKITIIGDCKYCKVVNIVMVVKKMKGIKYNINKAYDIIGIPQRVSNVL